MRSIYFLLYLSVLSGSIFAVQGCSTVADLAISQNRYLFNHIPKHEGLTLAQAVGSPPGLFSSSDSACFAALEAKFSVPNFMKTPDEIRVRIGEVEALLNHAKFGRIRGKYVEYDGEVRAYGKSCTAGVVPGHLAAVDFCQEVNNTLCLLVVPSGAEDDILLPLYSMLAESRRRAE